MVREYVKITARGTTSLEVMEEAARRVIDKKESLRTVAADFDVSKTLWYLRIIGRTFAPPGLYPPPCTLPSSVHCPVHLHTGLAPPVYTAFLLKPWPADIRTHNQKVLPIIRKDRLYYIMYIGYLLLVYLYNYIYGYGNGLIYGCVEEDTLY